ncbi:helix-turn-helix domain-containing protein [Streptococcus agalactiae]|uniref:helix-turn-helix domain-containing protein n=1 Tax=Streptococcus agalactiae TaxID=1311 RepID=UPI0002E41C34|nr:helix-turn-helix domain-containing protein [Streptococcus agalactiae]
MQVILQEEQVTEIQNLVSHIIEDEIEKFREDNGVNSPFLNKKQACTYLGVSNNTLDTWIIRGLPTIRIEKTIRFDKGEIRKWMNQLQN